MSASVDRVLAAAADLAGRMRDNGIAEEIISDTLADVDRQLRLHRRHTGRVGFDAPGWLDVVLSGTFYQLGRLQFDLRTWRPDEPRPPVGTSGWVLDVHIPATGPLTEGSVEQSFRSAADFFAEHFPDRPVELAVCESWLLDPYLRDQLPAASNLVGFQRLFQPYGQPRDDELDAMYFVFGQRSLADLDRLPRDTTLQRLVLDRITAGGSWQVVRGYRPVTARTANAP